MYVIKLNVLTGELYKAMSDEGFRITKDVQEATKFLTEKEARIILESYAVVTLYPEAKIERTKQ